MMLVGAGLVALLLVGGGSFLLAMISDSESESATTGEEAGDAPQAGTDGAPAAETLFSQETVELSSGELFTLVETETTQDCAAAAHGGYGDVLADNGCVQVARASYASEDKTHAVTVGVATFEDPDSAAAAQEGRNLESTTWFAGLAGPEDSGAERLDYAGGHGSGALWERHLLFSLAVNSDGRLPPGEQPELRQISDELLELPLGPLGRHAAE